MANEGARTKKATPKKPGVEESTRSPEEIQADIEATRDELADTVAAVSEKADLKKQGKRKVDDVKAEARAKGQALKEKATQTVQQASGKAREAAPASAADAAQQTGQGVQRAAGQAVEAAQRNPILAAGGGAFAAGLAVGWVLGRR
jgi:hypothetical protein